MKEDLDNINTYLQKEVEVIVEELFIKIKQPPIGGCFKLIITFYRILPPRT